MKRILAIILCILFLFPSFSVSIYAEEYNLDAIIEDTVNLLITTNTNPHISSVGGEWSVIGIARNGLIENDLFPKKYLKNVKKEITDKNGIITKNKYTEYSRVILALTSIGKNCKIFYGYDLSKYLYDFDKVIYQGLNGPCYALIALNCNDYLKDEALENKYIDYILSQECENGGFKLSSSETDINIDITAMVLSCLSFYKERPSIKKVIDRNLNILSELQSDNGGYESYFSSSPETDAQIIIALSMLGIPYTDSRFVKNGNSILKHILSFYNIGNGFSHEKNSDFDIITTEQALLALNSVKRYKENKNNIFDMSDILITEEILEENNADVECVFQDVTANKEKIMYLYSKGIISGMPDNKFYPEKTISRAEFATIIVKALNLKLKNAPVTFKDVNKSDWFYDYVNICYSNKIIFGTSLNTFSPYMQISKEEAYTMIKRAYLLIDTNFLNSTNATDYLAGFIDYKTISDWAFESCAFTVSQNLIDTDALYLYPKNKITRREVAEIIYNMIEDFELL